MKNKNPLDVELASMLVDSNEQPDALFEQSLMEKITTEAISDKHRMQITNRIILVIISGYISLISVLIVAIVFLFTPAVTLKLPVYQLQLKEFIALTEPLLFYKLFVVLGCMALASFLLYYTKQKRSLN